jgi:iron complex transport system permease protein
LNKPSHFLLNTKDQPEVFYFGMACFFLTFVLFVLGIFSGSTGLDRSLSFSSLISNTIVMEIRLPRTIGAWLAGALLGISGAIAQGLFRNPLADPYLLGSSSGAALGVTIGLMLLTAVNSQVAPSSSNLYLLQQLGLAGFAFVGAWGAVLLTLSISLGAQQTLKLLLGGVVVGVILGAITSLLLNLYPAYLNSMQGFLNGQTGFITWEACRLMFFVLLVCLVISGFFSNGLNALVLGEETAQTLGVNVRSNRLALLVVMSLATATCVSQVGLIAFVGLAAPHIVRACVKCQVATSLQLSCLSGGALLCFADLIARSITPPTELPVGVLTALMGGGYLIFRLHQRSRRLNN